MAIDIDKHATMLLEFLHDSPKEVVSTYLSAHDLDIEAGMMLVDYLENRGLVRDHSTMGGSDASINAEGAALVQKLRAERMRPARRLGTLRSRMLTWLDEYSEQSGPSDWSEFLAGPGMEYHGSDFTEKEVTREADYLQHHGLIKAFSAWGATSGMLRPTITTQGRDCLVDFEGNVSDYLNRSQRPNNTTSTTNNITMTGSTGNITVASDNVVQNVNAGLDTTKTLDFAGYVRQTLPVLGLDQDTREVLNAQAEELHQEADTAAPDRGKLRRLLDAILEGLRLAAPTVVQATAIGLGEEAVKAITGA